MWCTKCYVSVESFPKSASTFSEQLDGFTFLIDIHVAQIEEENGWFQKFVAGLIENL